MEHADVRRCDERRADSLPPTPRYAATDFGGFLPYRLSVIRCVPRDVERKFNRDLDLGNTLETTIRMYQHHFGLVLRIRIKRWMLSASSQFVHTSDGLWACRPASLQSML
jgi:hypothetical protein